MIMIHYLGYEKTTYHCHYFELWILFTFSHLADVLIQTDLIQFRIICIALFTIQSLQSNFTEN